ncbi:MAG: sigma-70 family RNA polymerase sigma factor [Opitutaceae bacterium]|nr:sigma-70 family RNA polymerase sigma factor [Opitutaceae bacterium]
MMDDAALLRRYAETRDEAAFTELVRRHLDGVYSIALRRVGGDVHLAKDVSQQVFLGLARGAKRLSGHPVLAGWLYTTTRNTSANVVRGERRRKAHEQEIQAMQDMLSNSPAEADWNRLAPVIEEAVDQLGEGDRIAVLLRFVERRRFGEIGSALRLTEDAARKRVDRALEKLRVILGRRGVDSSAAALAVALTTNAVTAAPAGLAATIAGTAMAGAAAGGGALTFFALMSMTKIQAVIIGAIIVAGGIGFVSQWQTPAKFRDEFAMTRQQGDQDQRVGGENALLVRGSESGADEASRLRAEAEALQQRPARVGAMKAPMRPANTWKNRGRATPEDALETVFWATWSLDHTALGKIIALAPPDRERVEKVFALIPDYVREKLKILSPEEVFAGGWALEHNDRNVALRAGLSTAHGPDEFDVQFEVQRRGDDRVSSGNMRFRRNADGWQWVVPHVAVERMESDFRRAVPGPNTPGWVMNIWHELFGKKP